MADELFDVGKLLKKAEKSVKKRVGEVSGLLSPKKQSRPIANQASSSPVPTAIIVGGVIVGAVAVALLVRKR